MGEGLGEVPGKLRAAVRGLIPVQLRWHADPAHREALRSANGANLEAERATSIALAVLPAVLFVVVLVILATG